MTDEQFCKNDSTFDGVKITNIKELISRHLTGQQLKDYVEHHIIELNKDKCKCRPPREVPQGGGKYLCTICEKDV